MSGDTDMEREHCIKEAEIAGINTRLNALDKMVNGNGKKGMYDEVIEIKTKLPAIQGSIDDLSDRFDSKFDELTGKVQVLLDKRIVDDTEKSLKLSARQKLAAIIMGIISAAGVIVMIADMILKNKAG